jgi:multicomponent K+:H+ antiporter subunit G
MLWDILISISLVIGASFSLIGSYGLIKLDNPMSRLHAPTKAGTLGVGGILLGSMLYAFAYGEGSLHELLVMAFLFVTAPISAHFIAKTHIHTVVGGEQLPSPGIDETWAVLDVPPEPMRQD